VNDYGVAAFFLAFTASVLSILIEVRKLLCTP
jgi:hypothetical protein